MSIKNLTPHVIALFEGEVQRAVIDPAGAVARARVSTVPDTTEIVDDFVVPIVRSVYGEPIDLPDPQPGSWLVVSLITAQSAERHGRVTSDLLLTQDLVRDDAGRILGCRSLSRYGV